MTLSQIKLDYLTRKYFLLTLKLLVVTIIIHMASIYQHMYSNQVYFEFIIQLKVDGISLNYH